MDIEQGELNTTTSGSDVEMQNSQEEPGRFVGSMSPDWGDQGYLSEMD